MLFYSNKKIALFPKPVKYVFLRLILFLFSFLGIDAVFKINSGYLKVYYKKLEEDCGHLLHDSQAYDICSETNGHEGAAFVMLFLIIGIPSIIFLYRLLKRDFIQLREKYKK